MSQLAECGGRLGDALKVGGEGVVEGGDLGQRACAGSRAIALASVICDWARRTEESSSRVGGE